MHFFPMEKIEIETGMTLDEAVHRLRDVTALSRRWLIRPTDGALFYGEVTYDGFQIITDPFIYGRYLSLMLLLTGSFRKTNYGVLVSVETEYSNTSKVSVFVAFCMLLIFNVFAFVLPVIDPKWTWFFPMMTIIFSLLFFVALRRVSKTAMSKSRTLLNTIFQSPTIEHRFSKY
jgi:hypothetical protein